MKVYSVESEVEADENVTIKITETKEVESSVCVSDLKRQVENINNEIENLKIRHDGIVDEIIAINDDEGIALTVKEIPVKLIALIK